MKKVSVILAIILLLAVACDKNDENTVNPIPSSHKVYPVFHVVVENSFQSFGVDSVQLTVSPDIGWLGPVYTDARGFIGTQASGTFITDIDTTINGTDTLMDTSSVVFGFNPVQEYTFRFDRAVDYSWVDSFRIDYAITIDSVRRVVSADTVRVLNTANATNPTKRTPDSIKIVAQASDTLIPPLPDSTKAVVSLMARWFGEDIVVTDPNDTLLLPPDTTFFDTTVWAFFSHIDSLFMPIDSSAWCTIRIDTVVNGTDTSFNDFFVVRKDTVLNNRDTVVLVDTVVRYKNCLPQIASVRQRIYRTWGWADYDTTQLFTFPDTTKELIFTNGVLSIRNMVTDITNPATVYFKAGEVTTTVDSLALKLTMPDVEIFPDYQIIIKDE